MSVGRILIDLALSIVAEAMDRATGRRRAEEAIRAAAVARAMAEEALRLARDEREPRVSGWEGK